MFQVRIHGRGGQGVVTGAELLSIAAFHEGRHSQAFPSFGSERMGAPVMAFARIDEKEIRLREPVMQPDALIIQDPTLLQQVNLFDGLAADGYVLINSSRSLAELGVSEFLQRWPADHIATIGATELALKHIGRPAPNTALLGSFVALTGRIGLESLEKAIRQKFSGNVATTNVAAARAAHDAVKLSLASGVASHA